MRNIDCEKIEKLVPDFLRALGDDPSREGLIETPKRVARMCAEIFEGMTLSNDEIAEKFDKCFTQKGDDLVVMKDIPIFSFCEHHLALMYNMKVSVGYIPNGKVIGLSKIARIADMVGKRLQLQEKIGNDIYEILKKILNTGNIIVVIQGEHACMAMRGIKKPGTKTRTSCAHGLFRTNSDLRQEFLHMIED